MLNSTSAMVSRLFLLTVLSVLGVQAHPGFQNLIPNADVVPHPCKVNFMWRGVGHKNPQGGGALNPFGQDFISHGKSWARVCQLDSDGDGMTNGQELGDPRCVWQPGQTPERVSNISHPGVCNPWGTPRCQDTNVWVDCRAGEFKCDAINQPDVRNVTLRFPLTQVPAEDTTYMCMDFDLPQDGDFHLIATQPLIDNANVMHHIVLFGCADTAEVKSEPYKCMMGKEGCTGVLGLWTLGLDGECFYREAGFPIGNATGSFRRASLQFHWTNYDLRTDYKDSSGLTLYYTPNKRPYNAGMFSSGQTRLEIPPGSVSVEVTSTCNSKCTRQLFTKPVKIFSALSHMHYLGYAERVERFRDGQKLDDILNDEHYSYDNPTTRLFDPPLEILPGDELRTTCKFRSLSRKTMTYYGEGTYDEMCYGLLSYFPREHMGHGSCTSFGNVSWCNADAEILQCNRTFITVTSPQFKQVAHDLLASCNPVGECRSECPAAIARLAQRSGCFRGEMLDFTVMVLSKYSESVQGLKVAGALRSCSCPSRPEADPNFDSGSSAANSAWRKLPLGGAPLLTLLALALF